MSSFTQLYDYPIRGQLSSSPTTIQIFSADRIGSTFILIIHLCWTKSLKPILRQLQKTFANIKFCIINIIIAYIVIARPEHMLNHL